MYPVSTTKQQGKQDSFWFPMTRKYNKTCAAYQASVRYRNQFPTPCVLYQTDKQFKVWLWREFK